MVHAREGTPLPSGVKLPFRKVAFDATSLSVSPSSSEERINFLPHGSSILINGGHGLLNRSPARTCVRIARLQLEQSHGSEAVRDLIGHKR